MANFYGLNATKRDNTVPSVKIASQEDRGRMRVLYDKYTFTAIITTADVLKMMKIPKGAKVHEVTIKSADLGTTGILNVGWEASAESGAEIADPNGFFSVLDVKAAPVYTSLSKVGAVVPGSFKTFLMSSSVSIS